MEFGLSADFPRCACAALPLDVLGGLLTDFELGFPSCSCSRSTAVTFPRVFVLTCGGKKPSELFVFASLPKYRYGPLLRRRAAVFSYSEARHYLS